MFFRKNKAKDTQKSLKEEKAIIVNSEELIKEANSLSSTINSVLGDDRIKVLNEIGGLYFQAGKIDDAIKYYEISVKENKSLGKAYTDLIKLYNIKMKEAIRKKDDEKMKYYMDKTDELLKLSKNVNRGKI